VPFSFTPRRYRGIQYGQTITGYRPGQARQRPATYYTRNEDEGPDDRQREMVARLSRLEQQIRAGDRAALAKPRDSYGRTAEEREGVLREVFAAAGYAAPSRRDIALAANMRNEEIVNAVLPRAGRPQPPPVGATPPTYTPTVDTPPPPPPYVWPAEPTGSPSYPDTSPGLGYGGYDYSATQTPPEPTGSPSYPDTSPGEGYGGYDYSAGAVPTTEPTGSPSYPDTSPGLGYGGYDYSATPPPYEPVWSPPPPEYAYDTWNAEPTAYEWQPPPPEYAYDETTGGGGDVMA